MNTTLYNIEYFEDYIEDSEITVQTDKTKCLVLDGTDKIESVEKVDGGFKIKFYHTPPSLLSP